MGGRLSHADRARNSIRAVMGMVDREQILPSPSKATVASADRGRAGLLSWRLPRMLFRTAQQQPWSW